MSKLKLMDYEECQVLYVCAILNYLKERGYKNIVSLKTGEDNKPYIKIKNQLYIYCDEEDSGEKFKFENINDVLQFSGELGRFHKNAEGFIQPSGIKASVGWGRKMEKYRGLVSKFEKYIDSIGDREKLTSFEEATLPYCDVLLKKSRKSLRLLRTTKYLDALESSMKRKEICLNSISSNTARKYGEDIIITKVFDMGYNMAEEDIAELIKRYLELRKDKGDYGDIIKAYKESRELSNYSLEIIIGLVSFPVDTLKIISKYIKYSEREDILLDKFNKYILREIKTDILEV